MKHLIYPLAIMSLSYASPSLAAAPVDDSKMPEQILYYVNQYRTQHHLPPMKLVPMISQQAVIHSQEMAEHHIPFGHVDFNKRINYLYGHIQNCRTGAENVAYNYRNAQHVVSQWLTSPGHKRNIQGNFNLTGIGVARDAYGKLYFTQIFLKTA